MLRWWSWLIKSNSWIRRRKRSTFSLFDSVISSSFSAKYCSRMTRKTCDWPPLPIRILSFKESMIFILSIVIDFSSIWLNEHSLLDLDSNNFIFSLRDWFSFWISSFSFISWLFSFFNWDIFLSFKKLFDFFDTIFPFVLFGELEGISAFIKTTLK